MKISSCIVCRISLWTGIILVALLLLLTGLRFCRDEPVVYADPVEHFKYGSTGGDRVMGFPKRVFRALPEICGQYLPGKGYASLGMIFEPGHDLPVGMSQRRHMGIDRTFLNCAVCHTSTVRVKADAKPMLVVGMGANTFNLMAFEKFINSCMRDVKFSAEYLVPVIQAQATQEHGAELSLLDRYVVYPVAIALMRDRVTSLMHRMRFIDAQPDWGPGRVDTFNSAKAVFNFPIEQLPHEELLGTADFPTIWNQGKKTSMQLHWDGNNNHVEERNLNAAFGTGATPPSLDHAAMTRIQLWNASATPPPFEKSFPIDPVKAQHGATIYKAYCAACHGASGSDFSGEYVGKVTPLKEIGTDPNRLNSFTPALAENLGTPYAGTAYRFTHFRKTWGYANAPLDGLWLRAPYLHNGSVPTLWDLLQPESQRPTHFYRGNDLYDPMKLGFVADVAKDGEKSYFAYDTEKPGNSMGGHTGKAYGTELPDDDKWALIEYLKTF
jgi:hypothetical protein